MKNMDYSLQKEIESMFVTQNEVLRDLAEGIRKLNENMEALVYKMEQTKNKLEANIKSNG